MPAPQRLFLVDGYSTIFRAYYAIRGLSSSRGEPTNAIYGFLNMLRKLLREEQPELIGVALDISRKTVRSERYAEYKANRTPMPDDLKVQMPVIRELLDALRIPILELASYEADDVLGTLARRGAEAGFEVVLVSADKDLFQLVGPGIRLFHTGREKLYDEALVEEDFGVPPAQVADVLALMGDSVDNVPGVPGIGEKGAKALIREHGSLEVLLDHAAEVGRKAYREGLLEHRQQALLSKELATIHTDLDLAFDPVALSLDEPDPQALREIYSRCEFFSLLEELESSQPAEQLPPAKVIEGAAELPAELDGILELLAIGSRGVVLAAGGEPLWCDFRRPELRDAVLERLQRWLGEGDRRVVTHDVKELYRLVPEVTVRARVFDVMLASYLLRPALRGHTLPELALETLRHRALTREEVGWAKGEEPEVWDTRLAAYAGECLELTRRLAERLGPELAAEEALSRLYEEIEAPLALVLVRMEEAGVLLDVGFLRRLSAGLQQQIATLEEEVYTLAGERFNLNSPQQLGVILFEKLAYPVLKKTRKTKSYSTSAETLEELAARGFPLPERILRYRELAKLESTYVSALPQLVGSDGRLHTTYLQAVAATGRLSSVNPNLQNIPVRSGPGAEIRRAFVAPPGRLLLVADYSQIELRVLAHIAEDEGMIDAFARGEDIHRRTAARVFGGDPAMISSEQRRAAKVINFGILYGMSAYGLSRNLGIPPKEAQRFIDAYFDQVPGVRRYVDETLERAEAEGKVETLYGRVRWLPELASRNRNLRENAKRMAINARIQGTAADLLKLAMIAVSRRLEREHPEAQLLLSVHDELVLEVPATEADEVARIVAEEMAGVAQLRVPLVVESGWGPSWYEAKA